MGNRYEQTAQFYDFDNRDNLRVDIPFYQEYAEKLGGPVLELGYGTGRVSLALAESGVQVHGLDLSPDMLVIFRDKLSKCPAEVQTRVRIVEGSMTDFDLGQRFALIIMPFRVFQALTEEDDITRCLACVRKHLAPGGRFIVNAFRPRKDMRHWCFLETVQWEREDESTGARIVKKHGGDSVDLKRQIIYPHFAFEITQPDGATQRIEEALRLKYWYPRQLQKRLRHAGFRITEQFGWYDRSPMRRGSREQIYVCELRREN